MVIKNRLYCSLKIYFSIYLSHNIGCSWHVTCVIWHVLHDTCHSLRDMWHVLRDMWHVLRDMCHVLHDMCHVLHDTCCDLSDIWPVLDILQLNSPIMSIHMLKKKCNFADNLKTIFTPVWKVRMYALICVRFASLWLDEKLSKKL